MTLNFLRQATLNPTKSAWELFNAAFDYAATPIGPLGCRIIIHKKSLRNSWDFCGKYGWILGCSLEYYRCQRVAPKDTKAVQVSNTLEYFHHYLTQPTLTPEYRVLHGLQTLTCALEDAPIQMCDKQLCAIIALHNIFGHWTKNVPTYPQRNKASIETPSELTGEAQTKPAIQLFSGPITKPTTHLPSSPAQAPRVKFMQTPTN